MTKPKSIYTLGQYNNLIIKNFIVSDIGINLNKLGRKTSEAIIKINIYEREFIDINIISSKIRSIISFIQDYYSIFNIRPLWQKINVIDQAINLYVGIGFLSLKRNWLKFIIDYLVIDRAEQGGDTIFTIFEVNFKWAVSFTLQDNDILKIEKYEI